MLNTILFDMGGTLEDIWYDSTTENAMAAALLERLRRYHLDPGCSARALFGRVFDGMAAYKIWSEHHMLEKKPDEIWTEYCLRDFDLDRNELRSIAEELADLWEVTYYHRELRHGAREMLEALKVRGYRLGVISNTASLYSVFNVLEDYGIRNFFQDVTLSSVTGFRKPNPEIFRISMRQMQARPENCVYLGDTISRDIIGAKQMGFGKAVQILSFLTAKKDTAVSPDDRPDLVIKELPELVTFLDGENPGGVAVIGQ